MKLDYALIPLIPHRDLELCLFRGHFLHIPLDSLIGRTSDPFILDITVSQGALRGGSLCRRRT